MVSLIDVTLVTSFSLVDWKLLFPAAAHWLGEECRTLHPL